MTLLSLAFKIYTAEFISADTAKILTSNFECDFESVMTLLKACKDDSKLLLLFI